MIDSMVTLSMTFYILFVIMTVNTLKKSINFDVYLLSIKNLYTHPPHHHNPRVLN